MPGETYPFKEVFKTLELVNMDTIYTHNGQYQHHIDYIICSQRWRSTIESAKTRPGADYGSDHQLLIAKFKLKLKKVEKTTRPFKYDLNKIPYDYTVEVTNRFQGLDLVYRVLEELGGSSTLYSRQ